jgi:hypothetical protein
LILDNRENMDCYWLEIDHLTGIRCWWDNTGKGTAGTGYPANKIKQKSIYSKKREMYITWHNNIVGCTFN